MIERVMDDDITLRKTTERARMRACKGRRA